MALRSSQGLNYFLQLTLMKIRTGGLDTVFMLFLCFSTTQATANKDIVAWTNFTWVCKMLPRILKRKQNKTLKNQITYFNCVSFTAISRCDSSC